MTKLGRISRGFTLIELLVVISIVALLASVVLAALNTARDKGRIGAGRLQNTAIQHAIGDRNILRLDFDECSACTSAVDTSGSNHNGTLQAGAARSGTTYNGAGYSVSFNGAGAQYILGTVGSGSDLDLPGDVTLSAWVYPTTSTSGTVGTIIRVGVVADERYSLTYNYSSQAIGFQWYDGASFPSANSSGNVVPLNRWSFIAAVRSGTKVSFYVNGAAAGTGTSTAAPVSAANYNIGAAAAGTSAPYTGLIDEARIYSVDLTAQEIKDTYLAEAPLYGLAAK